MPAQPESYAIASGGVLSAGRYATRPVLCGLGTSKIEGDAGSVSSSGNWTGQAGYGHHKWMNTILRKPFDYVHGSGGVLGRNGFFGIAGATATTVASYCDAFIDAVSNLVGSRRCCVALNAEGNSLYEGTSASSVWGKYQEMRAKFDNFGWNLLINEATPSSSFSTVFLTNNAVAFTDIVRAAEGVTNLGWMLNTFHDPDAWAYGLLNPLNGYTLDGKHFNIAAAVKVGLVSADVLAGRYPPWRPLAEHVVCSVNPTLSGTGGIKSGATGSVPDGFTLTSSVGTTIGTQTDDGYEIECTYSGAAFASGQVTLYPTASQISNVVVGETWHECIGDVEIIESENFGFAVYNFQGGGTGYIPGMYSLPTYTAETVLRWSDWLAGRRIVLHSDPFIATDVITRTDAGLMARPFTGATYARLKLRVRWLGVKQA